MCTSPDTVRTWTSPVDAVSIRTSPEALVAWIERPAALTSTSPDAVRAISSPPMDPTRTSPDPLLNRRSPPTLRPRTSPLPLFVTTLPSASSNERSPEPVWKVIEPSRPRTLRSAEPVPASTFAPRGMRNTMLVSLPHPKNEPRRFRCSITSRWRPSRPSVRSTRNSSGSGPPMASVVVAVSPASISIVPDPMRISTSRSPGV